MVTDTASARISTPLSISALTSAPNRTSLAMNRFWSKLEDGFTKRENRCMFDFKNGILFLAVKISNSKSASVCFHVVFASQCRNCENVNKKISITKALHLKIAKIGFKKVFLIANQQLLNQRSLIL